jgi:hypothetical protein
MNPVWSDSANSPESLILYGLIQAGSLHHGVLIQAGWRVSFFIPFLSNRNTE